MDKHVCPWYIGYFLVNPIRNCFQNPMTILGPHIKPGMKVLEIGPGMGFFSLPMAKLVGETGRVVAVDLQEKMLRHLRRRAAEAKLLDRIETRLCNESSLQIDDLAGSVDFALAFAVIHEVPDQKHLITQISSSLKKGGLLLISEPKGHVEENRFRETISVAQSNGMEIVGTPEVWRSHSSVLKKN
jgi:ubiquinone/menaquinone biosynthesis C-methylase UbiE